MGWRILIVLLASAVLGGGLASRVANSHNGTAFTPPAHVQAINLVAGAGGVTYVPRDPAHVIAEVHRWLATASIGRRPQIPAHQPMLLDYLGPPWVTFLTGAGGTFVNAYPTFYLVSHGPNKAVTIHYFPDLLTYVVTHPQSGTEQHEYLHVPGLYRYLLQMSRWRPQFIVDETNGWSTRAMHALRTSLWGHVAHRYPLPDQERAATSWAHGQTLYATRAAYAARRGAGVLIILAMTWDNGRYNEVWRFRVGPGHRVTLTGRCLGGSVHGRACSQMASG
jgi:hypothetical protein